MTYYRALAKRLSDVLLTVAPLGGSECFMRVGDEFFAEPEFFKQRIAELHSSRHEALQRAIRAERCAVTATNREGKEP